MIYERGVYENEVGGDIFEELANAVVNIEVWDVTS